jgi:selenocysteine-specific elongation factor
VVTKAWVERQRAIVTRWLTEFHAQHPNKSGAPGSAARQSLAPSLAAIVFAHFPAVRIDGDLIALTSHRASFSDLDRQLLTGIEQSFRSAGFAPPSALEVLGAATTDSNKGKAMLEALVKSNRLVRISGDLIFHADVIAHIRNSLAKHKGRRFTVPEFKEWTQVSRKYAIPLLEYLDRQRVTRREGESRVVL